MKNIFYIWLKSLAVFAMTFVLANDVSCFQNSTRFIEIIESEVEEELNTKVFSQFSLDSISLIHDGGNGEAHCTNVVNRIGFDFAFVFNSLFSSSRSVGFICESRPLFLLNCSLVIYE